MNPRWVARSARWAAAAAILVALVVAAIFARRSRIAARALRHGPAAVPASVAQQSLEFTFSKVDGQQTVFTVHAARATEYSGKNQSLLEDVDIVVYGRHGERHDEIHTHSCDYVPATNGITCHGTVEMDLASVPAPGQPVPAAADIQLEARNVSFDGQTGDVSTDAPLLFRFPRGHGSAVGLTYSSHRSDLALERNVELSLSPDRPGMPPVNIDAGRLDYDRSTRQMSLAGPVRIDQGDRSLESGAVTLALDDQLRPRRALAAGGGSRVRMRQAAAEPGGEADNVQADAAEILFDDRGRAETVNASGHVLAEETGASQMRLQADRVSLTLDSASQEPRDVQADGSAEFAWNRAGRSAQLQTASLQLALVPGARAGGARLERAESPGPATASWNAGDERLRLAAGRLVASFGEASEIRRLDGTQGVRLDRQVNGAPPLMTRAAALEVHFAGGQWADAQESGQVRARQGTRTASASRAKWVRATDDVELTEDARVSDVTGETTADSIDWNQQTGKLHASGHVRSSYFGTPNGQPGIMPATGPANVIAQTLDANPASGEAVYTGSARLWQGDLAIQADRIDLRRADSGLAADGNVLAAFPQANAKAGPMLWLVRARKVTYRNGPGAIPGSNSIAAEADEHASGLATLEGGVEAISREGQIDARRMILVMQRDAQGRAGLAQAVGRGGVTVRQGDRWGVSGQAVYSAATGQIVMSGAHPSLHDAAGDVVTGDELTFSVADDTILVESAEGSRTSIRHPVPK